MTQLYQVKELIFGKLEYGLARHLSYHNIEHTTDVMQAVAYIAGQEGVDDENKRLLLTAALFHDTGFLTGREQHENASCHLAIQYLPLFGYSQEEIEIICNMIMATMIPQSPRNKLEQILCDADLDYLGREDFFILSNRLFRELQAENIVKDEEEWNRQQADFMGDHHYFTETSINLHQAKKEQYVELIKSKISNNVFNENQ